MEWWIAAYRLDRGTPEYAQFISKEVLAWLNWILFPQYLHSHNIFSENLRKVDVWKQGKEVNKTETPHRRQKKVFISRKKQDVKLELVVNVQSDLSE